MFVLNEHDILIIFRNPMRGFSANSEASINMLTFVYIFDMLYLFRFKSCMDTKLESYQNNI